MRVAVVVPYLGRIHGNRLGLTLAAELGRRAEVELLAHTVRRPVQAEAEAVLAGVPLRSVHWTDRAPLGMPRLVLQQVRTRMDRAIARAVRTDPNGPPDVVLVVANEGHALGGLLRTGRTGARPRTAISVAELLDYPFRFRRERPHRWAREALRWLAPIAHRVEVRRLRWFDRVYTNSRWTAENLARWYGIPSLGSLASVDARTFRPVPGGRLDLPERFVAVPTVSLDAAGRALVADLARRGVPLVAFGPGALAGVDFRGYLDAADLVELLARAAVTFFPFDYEALGLPPLESLACGTPVITFPKQGPYRELAGHPYVRFASDPAGIESACRAALAHRPSAAEVRESARPYFAETVAARLLDSWAPDGPSAPGDRPVTG